MMAIKSQSLRSLRPLQKQWPTDSFVIYVLSKAGDTPPTRGRPQRRNMKKKTLQRRNYFLGSCAIRVSILKGGSVAAMVF